MRKVHSLLPRAQRRFASSSAANLPSFAKALFSGRLESAAIYPYPALDKDTKDTLSALVEPVEQFFTEVNDAAENDRISDIPDHVKASLKEMGAYGLQVPQELGGIGLNNTGYARLVEVVGGNDLGLGIHLGSHQSIGYKGIVLYGNEAQKAKYLPPLASGEKIAAFALTEPGAGSDAAGIKTRATLSADGKTWILNGSKIWISNGGYADVMTVFAKTEVTDAKTGEKKDKVTAFIVERAFGGVTSGPPEKKMGINCSNTCEVFFENCPVPAENVLVAPGDGFKIAMGILNNGRFGMGAALTGTMKFLVKNIAAHVDQRKQFGIKLRDFGVIKGKLASMTARLYAAESLAYFVAGSMDSGAPEYALEAAASKIFASEAAWFCSDEAIQIMGGLGFMRSLPYERIMRDLRIFRIFEGTNEILRLLIGLQGMQAAGKALEPVQKAMKNPLANLGTLASFGVGVAKSKVLGYNEKPALTWAAPSLRPAAAIIEDTTAELGVVVQDVLMKYGKKIMDEQLITSAVADVIIDLTAATAAVSRATTAVEKNLPSADHEVLVANLFVEEAKFRMRNALGAAKGAHSTLNKLKYQVSDQIVEKGSHIAAHPCGV